MATTQPTPQPPNPTTDSEETPPTTNQQTQEPTDPPTTTDRPVTDAEGTDAEPRMRTTTNDRPAITTVTEGAAGTELRVPTTSETATDLRSQGGPSDIGLIIGIVVVVMVVIALVVTVVIVIAVLFKKRGNTVRLNKKRALSNPMYSAQGQPVIIV